MVEGRGGEGELLAAWLGDAVLAQRLKWPFALPLLAAPVFSGVARGAGGDGAEGTVMLAYARAAVAVDLSGVCLTFRAGGNHELVKDH